MALPDQLLLSDLLRRQVRCDQGHEHGVGVLAWMHPPVHRLLGWISKPNGFGSKRQAWRLNQLRGLGEAELFVQGEGADTDLPTVERLPTLIDAALIGHQGQVLGSVADAAVELSSGRILHTWCPAAIRACPAAAAGASRPIACWTSNRARW